MPWDDTDSAAQVCDPAKLKRLLSAVVVRAISDFVGYRGRKLDEKQQRTFDEAETWLMSDREKPDRGVGFTFVQACYALDLDVGAVRKQLYLLRVEELERFRRVMSPDRSGDEEEYSAPL